MTETTKWVYPPNFNGDYGEGKNGNRRIVMQFTHVYVAANETDVVKVNRSELRGTSGLVPDKLVVEKVEGLVQGIGLSIEWDTTPHELITRVDAGVSTDTVTIDKDFTQGGRFSGLVPSEEGGTGDIIFTTSAGAAGDSYDITLTVRLKE